MYTKYLTDCAQRNAFLETRRSIETRYKIEKENAKQVVPFLTCISASHILKIILFCAVQEKLLLSVLPRFVALEIISDIANQDESRILPTQFHKIYIHCYKDVR